MELFSFSRSVVRRSASPQRLERPADGAFDAISGYKIIIETQ